MTGRSASALSSELLEAADDHWATLITAFWRYERALVDNDLIALRASFVPWADTIRSDGSLVLVGADEIDAYRAARVPPPPRTVQRLHVRSTDPSEAVIVAESTRADGGRGIQTQVWQRTPSGWQIGVAHVAALPAPSPPATVALEIGPIWRVIRPEPPARRGGTLAGVRIAVKDLVAVAGERIGAGNPAWLAAAAAEPLDAPALAGLLAAGAHVTGIAQTDELAFSIGGNNAHYGMPANAAAPGRITGGSTSGPAAAVAAGLADLGLGTDTAGSIRVPASYCGLYGWRPTHGVVPVDRVLPLAPSFDTVGLVAASPRILDRAARVLLQEEATRTDDVAAITEIVIAEDLLLEVDEPVRIAFAAALRALLGISGVRVRVEAQLGDGQLESWFTAFRTVQAHEAWEQHGRFITEHPGALDPVTEARFRTGSQVSAHQAEQARALLAGARTRLDARLPPGAALALPATSTAAPPADLDAAGTQLVREATLRLTFLASASGRPAVVVPTLRLGALPAGLSLIGFRGQDLALLDLGLGHPANPSPTQHLPRGRT